VPVAGATLSLGSVEVRLFSFHNTSGNKNKAYSLLHAVDFSLFIHGLEQNRSIIYSSLLDLCHHAPYKEAIVNRT
jgi:hypothetical protein